MAVDYLVVGLGNPGPEYVRSPHNAGFEVAEKVRAACGGPHFVLKGQSALSPCRWRGNPILVVKPLNYMNLSGAEVSRYARKESMPLDRIIVCYDDLDLPLGQVRLRSSGGPPGTTAWNPSSSTSEVPTFLGYASASWPRPSPRRSMWTTFSALLEMKTGDSSKRHARPLQKPFWTPSTLAGSRR